MEKLSEPLWDVVIDGTGVQQSLLALALSRSDKKVLHVDRNDYYGGSEAAFSLQEAEEWVKKVNEGSQRVFSGAQIYQAAEEDDAPDAPRLSFPRAYTLTLSPQIIYNGSNLLAKLVSSKVHKQLEFQAVGSWWMYSKAAEASEADHGAGRLLRLPNGREDIFTDSTIDNRAKRSLMKFLKFVIDREEQREFWEPHADAPLVTFLEEQFNLPERLRVVVLALTLSFDEPAHTTVAFSLPRIERHLTSIGVFGPGFGSVFPKWGGGAELAQVACRAGAVGGGTYFLGSGIKSQTPLEAVDQAESGNIEVLLGNGEAIKTRSIVTAVGEEQTLDGIPNGDDDEVCKMISIIASPLASMFEAIAEGSPSAAVSVAVFPANTLSVDFQLQELPVYILAHSADTGECPKDQTILYIATKNTNSAQARLKTAITAFLGTFTTDGIPKPPKILYDLTYVQRGSKPSTKPLHNSNPKTCKLPTLSTDLAFSDEALDRVEEAWRMVMGLEAGDDSVKYLEFEERAGMDDDDDDNAY